MLPTLFEVGGVAVPAYFVTTTLGYTVGFWWLHRSASKVLADADGLVGLYMSLFVSGWLGARLMHIVGGLGRLSPADILGAFFETGGGVAFLGGVLGGTLGAVAYMLWTRLPVWKLLDVAAAPLLMGLAVGRVGCTLAGCCHGRAMDATVQSVLVSLTGGDLVTVDAAPFVAVVYRPVGHGSIFEVPVYPTQLFEVVAAAGLALGLAWIYRRFRRFDGQVFAMMLAAYGLARWVGEGMRGDVIRGADHAVMGASFSTGELSSMVLLGLAAGMVAGRFRGGVGPEPVPSAEPLPVDGVADLSDLDD